VPTISLAGTERGIDETTPVAVTLSYSFTDFSQTLNGTTRIPDPLGREASSHVWRLEGELVLGRGWSLLLSLPVTSKARRMQLDTLTATYRATGIGDAIALLKRRLLTGGTLSPWSITAGLGVKAPTGASDREEYGVRLPRDLQPGTGTWEVLAWGFTTAVLLDGLSSVALSATVRLPLTADELDYRNGTEVQLLLIGSWFDPPLPELLPALALRLRMTGRDRLGTTPFPATGGTWLDALPSLMLQLTPFALRLQGVVPVWYRTQGIQLVPSWGITAELHWSLSP